MAGWTLPMEGSCRCGQARFRVSRPPLFTAICHCTGCQKMTGGAYSTSVAVPIDGFTVTEGQTVIGGVHGERLHHQHCDHCKSWMFTTFEPATGFVNVRAMMLDDPRWFTPFIENYTSEAFPWARVDAPHSYEKFPAMEQYPALLAEFAAINAA
jgi:hypothetical protein